MLKTRFLTPLAAKALVVAVMAGGGLLIGGVANAATLEGSPGNVTALPIIGDPSDGTGGGLNPGQIVDLVVGPIVGGLLSGEGGLDLGGLLGGSGGLDLGGLLGGAGGGLDVGGLLGGEAGGLDLDELLGGTGVDLGVTANVDLGTSSETSSTE